VSEEGALVIKPAKMTFSEAAAISLAGNTALFYIRDFGKNSARAKNTHPWCFRRNRELMLYSLPNTMGAEVTGVCSAANAEMLKSLGATKVIDYTKEDFTKSGERF